MKRNVRTLVATILIVGAVVCFGVAAWFFLSTAPGVPEVEITPEPSITVDVAQPAPVPSGTPEPEVEATPNPENVLPVGKLVVTKARQGYTDGSLTLRIPILDVMRTIYNGTTEETLLKGVGLYDYAQLPGEGQRNVSLAGHRNGIKNGQITDHAPFYYVDRLKDGDYLYLTDATHIYRYLYTWTETVVPSDWSPIYVTEESSLTITSCTPIGVSDHRIVIRATLDEIFDYEAEFDYAPTREDVSA